MNVTGSEGFFSRFSFILHNNRSPAKYIWVFVTVGMLLHMDYVRQKHQQVVMNQKRENAGPDAESPVQKMLIPPMLQGC